MRALLLCCVVCFVCACGSAAKIAGNSEDRVLSKPFDSIVVGGLVNVELVKGEKPAVLVKAVGIDLKDIVTDVEASVLNVYSKGSSRGESIWVRVSYDNLKSIKTSGAATILSKQAIHGDKLNVQITESGDADLVVDVDQLFVDMSGAGNLTLSGDVRSQDVVSNGGRGTLNNRRLNRADK